MPLSPSTDTAQIDPGGAGAGLSPSTLDRLTLALKSASVEQLKFLFIKHATKLNTPGALRVSAELTARGIPPCFRGIHDRDSWLPAGSWLPVEAKLILLIADIQWIVVAYPKHETGWERAQHVYDPAKLEKTAEYLLWDGRRSPGQVATALGLTEQMQRECVWVQFLQVARWNERLQKRLPIAAAKIASAINATDKRNRAEKDATIKRRVNLWHCAELAGGNPQRTADLYLMLTGETLPRNVVAGQLAKLPKVRRTDSTFSLEGPAVG